MICLKATVAFVVCCCATNEAHNSLNHTEDEGDKCVIRNKNNSMNNKYFNTRSEHIFREKNI